MKTVRVVAVTALGLALLTGPAWAATHMMSFEPASPDAQRLTGRGVTVVFDARLLGQRVRKVMATAVPAVAQLTPAPERVLGGLKAPDDLYAIDLKAGQGPAYVRAFCPGSTRAWLSVSRVSRYPLHIVAVGDDPKAPGQARACADMTFAFKGEWRVPRATPRPDPMEDDHIDDNIPF